MSRVLIVEDEAHIAHGLQFNLEAEGHSAQIASDGETALDLLLKKGEKFDAMVLDVMLPGKARCQKFHSHPHAHGSRSARRRSERIRLWCG